MMVSKPQMIIGYQVFSYKLLRAGRGAIFCTPCDLFSCQVLLVGVKTHCLSPVRMLQMCSSCRLLSIMRSTLDFIKNPTKQKSFTGWKRKINAFNSLNISLSPFSFEHRFLNESLAQDVSIHFALDSFQSHTTLRERRVCALGCCCHISKEASSHCNDTPWTELVRAQGSQLRKNKTHSNCVWSW